MGIFSTDLDDGKFIDQYETWIFLGMQNCANPYSVLVEKDRKKGMRTTIFDKDAGEIHWEYWSE